VTVVIVVAEMAVVMVRVRVSSHL